MLFEENIQLTGHLFSELLYYLFKITAWLLAVCVCVCVRIFYFHFIGKSCGFLQFRAESRTDLHVPTLHVFRNFSWTEMKEMS